MLGSLYILADVRNLSKVVSRDTKHIKPKTIRFVSHLKYVTNSNSVNCLSI